MSIYYTLKLHTHHRVYTRDSLNMRGRAWSQSAGGPRSAEGDGPGDTDTICEAIAGRGGAPCSNRYVDRCRLGVAPNTMRSSMLLLTSLLT